MSTKNEILKYINETPENTNPGVIGSMLDDYNSANAYDGSVTGSSALEGDVIVRYNDSVIAALSDSGNLTLETEDTICEHDIEVEYTKPETPTATHTITLTRNGTPLSPAKSFTANVGSYVGEDNISLGSALEMPSCRCYLGDEIAYNSRAIPLSAMFFNSEGTVDLHFIMPDSTVFDRIDIEG